jgi:GGDEF domain-containing protein
MTVSRNSSILDPDTGWFQRYYFFLRLDRELADARLRNEVGALIAVKLDLSRTHSVTVDYRLREHLTSIVIEALRPGDFPASIGFGELAVYLPRTDRFTAQEIVERMADELEEFSPRTGVAAWPQDAETRLDLLAAASRFESAPGGKIIDFVSYKLTRQMNRMFSPRALSGGVT